MSSKLKVNNIIPSTGTQIGISTTGGGINLLTGTVVTGVVTATSFSGALTGTASGNPTLANGSNNRVITATGSNALTGEVAFTFDGSTATINGNTTDTPLILNTTSNNGSHMRFQKDGANQHFIGAGGGFALGDKEDLAFRAVDNLIFGVGTSEKLRITSDGKIIIGTEITNGTNADAAIKLFLSAARGNYGGQATNAVIFDNQTAGVDKGGTLTFAGYSGSSAIAKAAIRGGNEADASTNNGYFSVFTRPASGGLTEKLRILSDGEVLIGTKRNWGGSNLHPNDINKLVVTGTSPADSFDSQCYLEGSETSGAANTGGALAFGGHDGSNHRNWANIYGMKENGTGGNTASYMAFHTRAAGGSPAERLRIDSGGKIGINVTNPASLIEIVGTTNQEADITFNRQPVQSTADALIGQLMFYNNDDSVGQISVKREGDNAHAYMQFATQGSSGYAERLRITSTGQVRIDGSTSANHGLRFTPGGWNGYDNRMGFCGTSGGDFWWSSNWNPTDGARDHSGYATNFIRQNVPTGYISFGTGGVNASAIERLRITSDGTVTKYFNSSTVQAAFGGSGQVNGISAIPSMAGTPFVVGKDSGTTRSAHFAGNLKFDSGAGIDFSATSDAANNANVAELLDDYEEGRHIVTITGSSSNPTVNLTMPNLWYVKVGSMVHLSGELRWTTSSHGSGTLRISLPFAAKNLGTGHAFQGTAQTWNIDWKHDQSSTDYILSEVGGNTSYMFIRCASNDNLNENSLKLGSNVIGSANSGYGIELTVSLTYRAE